MDVRGAYRSDGRDVRLDEGDDACRRDRGCRCNLGTDSRTTRARARARVMFWRMVAVMRLVRCRLPPVVNRTGVQCRRLGGEHREPKTDEK
jgi:hypothetical protein